MLAKTYLIVNADDFGQSKGVNRGVMEAHERGVVRSASLMVRWPAAEEAAAYARRHTRLSLGLHVDLGEWRLQDGEWIPVYDVVSMHDRMAIEEEVERQLSTFRDLTGMAPTHLDSHQHVHRREPALSIMRELAGKLNVSLRHETREIQYCGDFYGHDEEGRPRPQAISPAVLAGIVARLPCGITELACHPALDDDLNTMYGRERALEVDSLCDPSVWSTIEEHHIVLCSFRDIAHVFT